jgi:hypothetical protein
MAREEEILERLAYLEVATILIRNHICRLHSENHTCVEADDTAELNDIRAAHHLMHEYASKFLATGFTVETSEGMIRRVEEALKQ